MSGPRDTDEFAAVDKGRSDPDIGLCDECGDYETPGRRQVQITRTHAGQRQQVWAWLCRDCRTVEASRG